jgi:hypothetical protein
MPVMSKRKRRGRVGLDGKAISREEDDEDSEYTESESDEESDDSEDEEQQTQVCGIVCIRIYYICL